MNIDYSIDVLTTNTIRCALIEMVKLDDKDFISEYTDLCKSLVYTKKEEMPSQECRLKLSSIITEAYFERMDCYPSGACLGYLADYCMLDYIKSVNKSSKDINQFHSEKQSQRRLAREYSIDTNDSLMDFLHAKYNLGLDSMSKVYSMEVED